jgi:NAD(P)H-dependent FMN reductase
MIDGPDREKPRFHLIRKRSRRGALKALADLMPARMTLAFAGARAAATSCSRKGALAQSALLEIGEGNASG